MAANKVLNVPPVTLVTTATNLLSPPSLAGGIGTGTSTSTYIIIRHITLVNRAGTGVSFSLFKGLSTGAAAGTEVVGSAIIVPANNSYTFYCGMRLDVGDYLTGLASSVGSLTIQIEGEIGVA